ncbi:MAG: hypothetical protein K0S00_1446 [Xanthobacteraceae bacterium]|jgi:hypothetical protein|nr:hypothetical protein [Xanthobacteraceae bacterium]
MTVRLRGHHLLCLLTFVGKGYTPAFTANYRRIVARLNQGEAVELVGGPDDICAPMLAEAENHCFNASVAERDAQALADVAALIGRPLAAGMQLVLDADLLARLRGAFAAGTTRVACIGCQWHALCTDIAAGNYAGVRLSGEAQNTPGISRAVRAL